MKLSIVVPIYNEEAVLPAFYKRLLPALTQLSFDYEILFVNDGSRDQSLDVLLGFRQQNPRVKIIDFSRNFGHQAAITAGLDRSTGDAVIMMDGDLQHPPEILPQLVQRWKEGALIVTPIKQTRTGEGLSKRWTAKGFYWLLQRISEVEITPEASDFRLLDRQVVDQLKQFPERHRFLRGLSSWMGFDQATLPYVQESRAAGQTKYSWAKMLRFSADAITSFSRFPLQWASFVGFFFALFAGAYGLYAIYVKLFTQQTVPGWASLMIVVAFLGGVQLCTLGIMGDYLGRVYEEVKRRPLYILKKTYD